MLVDGVAFKKTFSYAGFEQQPKSFKNPKILSLNVELELKAEKDNAEVRVEDVSVCRACGYSCGYIISNILCISIYTISISHAYLLSHINSMCKSLYQVH